MQTSLKRLAVLGLAAASLSLGAARPAEAQINAMEIASGLTRPVQLATPKGDERFFVIEQAGVIKLLDGNGGATVYLNLSGMVDDSQNEQGLLGIAFPENFATTGRFYVNYTTDPGAGPDQTVIARITVPDPSADTAGAYQLDEILRFNQDFSNHNGGWIGFAPGDTDGQYLYIPTGDGGSGNDPNNRAQTLNNYLGKLLRLDVSGNGPGYQIPADNFFAADGNTATLGEIVAYGLRNPFRCSFDSDTGDLWLGDVGQAQREEIDFLAGPVGGAGGENYGWRIREGFLDNPSTSGTLDPSERVDPVFDYIRNGADISGVSVTGGFVYRGGFLPAAYRGQYIFADASNSRIFMFDPADPIGTAANITADVFPNGGPGGYGIVSFAEDDIGELYMTALFQGRVYAIVPDAPLTPGDANGDGKVDLEDFVILRNNFGNSGNFDDGDFNGDGTVDLEDFVILRNNFGSGTK